MLKGEGRDTGGKGNAEALITAQLERGLARGHQGASSVTDIKLTGKVAQFGRLGVIRDTSEKLMTDFANNLNTMLDAEDDDPQEADALAAEPSPTPKK